MNEEKSLQQRWEAASQRKQEFEGKKLKGHMLE